MAAIIEDKIMCMHGGLSMELEKIEQVNDIKRPSEVPDSGNKSKNIKLEKKIKMFFLIY